MSSSATSWAARGLSSHGSGEAKKDIPGLRSQAITTRGASSA
jgi:hypothetical protein